MPGFALSKELPCYSIPGKGEDSSMVNILIFTIMAIVGGVPCFLMLLSIPILIGWKVYRKCRYNIALFD